MEEIDYSPGAAPVVNKGKQIWQGDRLISTGHSSSEADTIAAAANSRITQAQSMVMAEEMMGMESEAAREAAQLNYELTQKQIEANIERFPETSQLALSTAISAGSELNAAMSSAFESALDSLLPGWKETIVGAAGTAQADINSLTEAFKTNVLPQAMAAADEMSAQALSNVTAQLQGEIPDDVAAVLKRRSAEISQQIGVRGQAAQYLTARDLGITSLDLMQQGLANASTALSLGTNAYSGFANMLQAPVSSGINVTNLLKAYMAPQADIQSLYGTNQSVLANASIVPAGTAMQVGAQTIANAGQLAQSAYTSALEYNSQNYWNTQNLIAQKAAVAASKSASKFAIGGSVISAAGTVAAVAAAPYTGGASLAALGATSAAAKT